ncbi:MAG: hypothetical protein AABY22_04915 [Nanoarchaeota archaeon]
MTEEYMKKLIELAKEIHEMQLKESDEFKGKEVPVKWEVITLNSKINYLIGFILALEEIKEITNERR